jgi:cytochrome c peroxidase
MPSCRLALFAAALLLLLPLGIRAEPRDTERSGTRLTAAEPLPWSPDPPFAPAVKRMSALTSVGRQVFNDPSLSASGKMSCASCHDPAHAFGPPNDLPVQLGGKHLDAPGTRAVPSLMYGEFTPPFTEHFFDEDRGDIDQGPAGGRTWDGRVDRARDQIKIPLLAPNEMANESPAAIADAVKSAPYATELRTLFGDKVLDDPTAALDALGASLEAYLEYRP